MKLGFLGLGFTRQVKREGFVSQTPPIPIFYRTTVNLDLRTTPEGHTRVRA